MEYLNISFTHKNTDISVREKLALNNDEKKQSVLRLLKSSKNIKEVVVLSTCNRVEILACADDIKPATSHIIRCLAVFSGIFEDELFERADIYENSGAIHHLFVVASSLDSLVVGETQILGQLKEAFRFSKSLDMNVENLSKALEYAIKCAAKVRNETQISKNPISVSSVAVAKAKEIFGTLEGKTAVVVGAGEMGELAARHLISSGANVIVVNRSTQRVEALVDELGDKASWDSILKLKDYVNSYELIFSSTSAPHPVITDDIVKQVPFKRYFFDIAVPRDIRLTKSEDVEVFSVDDLDEIVKANLAMREEQAQIAYSIVSKDVGNFLKFIKDSISAPLVKSLRQSANEFASKELEKAIKKGYLKNSDPNEAKKLIDQVLNAFLHVPTTRLKEISNNENALMIADAARYIFDFKDKEKIDEIF
ncbi:glutamyl-tRNA reductase [Campylobacter mucosalis]|uniref:glutamyl-tRNA reductase n=1 Tax=Campylobacter mucosalis TaxID=202 RepID=UPI00147047D0|nr:glutamyl-tRNA reductase [Campylobacter mucosalis]